MNAPTAGGLLTKSEILDPVVEFATTPFAGLNMTQDGRLWPVQVIVEPVPPKDLSVRVAVLCTTTDGNESVLMMSGIDVLVPPALMPTNFSPVWPKAAAWVPSGSPASS